MEKPVRMYPETRIMIEPLLCEMDLGKARMVSDSLDLDRGDEAIDSAASTIDKISSRSSLQTNVSLPTSSMVFNKSDAEKTSKEFMEENSLLKAELMQVTRKWLLLKNKTKYLQDNYDSFFKLRTEYQELMEQSQATRQPRLNASTQTWNTIVCANCIETRAWLESPLIQELQQYRHSPVAILSKTELTILQQTVQDLRRRLIEYEQTHERRMDHEEIMRLRQRRTLLEAKLRTNYRELQAAKENIKILQMIIIKLERHRRAVMEAVKLDALLPSTCLSSVITDEEQWIVRRIVSRFLSKAAKTDLIKVTDPSVVSPPSSVCSRQNTDIDFALQAHASCKVISQSSLNWPSHNISEVSFKTMDSKEANDNYKLAEMMIAEEAVANATRNQIETSKNIIPSSKMSNSSIHILLPAGSSVSITEAKEEIYEQQEISEIVYVSPACTPPQKLSKTVIVKRKSKVEFTPITSAHLLFHTEEGVKKVNPFLEALKKISNDLAKFALPIKQSDENDLSQVELNDNKENDIQEVAEKEKSSCEVDLVYLSPTMSPTLGSSTTIHDISSAQTEDISLDHEEAKSKLSNYDSESESTNKYSERSYPALQSPGKRISNDIDIYTKPPCNKKCQENYVQCSKMSIESSNLATKNSTSRTSRRTESQYTSDTYSCRMAKRYKYVLDIPFRQMNEPESIIKQPRHVPDLSVLSKGILRNLNAKPRKTSEKKQHLGNEINPSDFFDQFS